MRNTDRAHPRWGFAAPRLFVVLIAWLAVYSSLAAPAEATRAQTRSRPDLVRIPLPKDDGSLTPYTYETGYSLVTLVYDTLLWRDQEGIPQPWLARSVETSPDHRQVTVRLNDGVRWQDGTALTAGDVAFTFRFVAEHPQPRFTPEVADVGGVDVADPLTAVINLRQSSAGFNDQPLADMPILPAHIWGSLPSGQPAPEGLPMGSGPYRLVEHRQGESYRFESNGDYFKGRPAVSRIDVPVIPSSTDTLSELQRGGVDMVPDSLPPDKARSVSALGTSVITGPSYLGTVVMFNLRNAPFDRVEARQAVAASLDLTRLLRAVGPAVAADRGYLHPESRWAAKQVLHRFDEQRARDMFRSMRLPPIEVLAPNDDPQRAEAGRQVALALQRVGVSATSKSVSDEELSKAVGEDGSAPTFQLAIWRAPALASYDPDYLSRLFGSHPPAPSLNYSGYANPAFDALAQRVSTTVDPTARQAVIDDTLKVLATDSPVVPLYFATGTYGIRPGIYDGWVFIKGSGILDKRSFLGPGQGASAAPAQGGPAAAPQSTSNGGGFPLGYAAVGLIVAAAGIALYAWRKR